MSNTAQSVQNIFQTMPTRLDPSAAGGLNAVIQYDLSGEGGGQYAAHIHDGRCEVSTGQHASPTMTLSMVAQDFVDLIEGRLDGMTAFMSGKLRIGGDMGLAMRMQSLFKA
jgi:putative sterol carrier protein